MKKTFFALISVLAISSWMTACSSGSTSLPEPPATTASTETTAADKAAAFSTGFWDDYAFTNSWLGITIAFPEDCIIATKEDIQKVVGTAQEIIINDGVANEAQAEASEFASAYDFLVTLPDQVSSIQLAHQNVSSAVTTLGHELPATDYLEGLKEQLTSLEDYRYEFGEVEPVTLGNQSFSKLHASMMDGAMFQDYYCISNGKYMSYIVASYLPSSAETVQSIIDGITAAK